MSNRPYKFIIGVLIALHVFLTPVLVRMAYTDRGQMAVGGEYLALPLIAIALLLIVGAIENKIKTNSKGE